MLAWIIGIRSHRKRSRTHIRPLLFSQGAVVLRREFFDRSSPIRVKGHTPVPSAGCFWRLQLKIHDDRLLAIPHDYSFARLIWISINLLVRHIRGNVNKISGSGFVTESPLSDPVRPCGAPLEAMF
jgi:hypothetical protein